MEKKINRKTKVIKIDEQDVKKMQRQQFLEKRRAQSKEKKSIKEKLKFSKTDIVVLVIIAIGVLLYYLISNYHKLGFVFNKDIDSADAVVIETMNTEGVVIGYKNNIILFEKGYLTAYDSKGNREWQKKLEEIYNPEISVAGDYIQITNNDTGYIYVLDGQYEVGRIKLAGEILSASINNEGTSVVEYSTSGLKTVIGVYNKKGKEQCSLKLDNNTVSSYSISDNSRYLAYAYADISGISLVTKITVIDLKKLGQEDYLFEDIVSKNNELVYKLFWDGNKLHAMLNNSIIQYNAWSSKLEEFSISDINATNLDIYNGRIAYITTDASTAKYVLYVDKYSGKSTKNVEIKDTPKHFVFENDLIYICSQNEINIYNKWGSRVKTYTSDMTITKPIIFDDGKCVALKISNKIIMFKI